MDALPADVLEIAILDAHAGGVGVADNLRDAVLAYSSQGSRESAGRDLEARRRAAHREAARLQAQNRAVRAQNEQVIRRRSRANPAQPPDSAEPAGNEAEDDPGPEEH